MALNPGNADCTTGMSKLIYDAWTGDGGNGFALGWAAVPVIVTLIKAQCYEWALAICNELWADLEFTAISANSGSNAYYLLANMPATSVAVYAHLGLHGIMGGWGANQKQEIDITFQERDSWLWTYSTSAAPSSAARIVAYKAADNSYNVYALLPAAGYGTISLWVTAALQCTVYPNPASSPSTPAGTLVFDSANSAYLWHLVGAAGKPGFENAWVNNVGSSAAGFHKDAHGLVHLKGVVKNGGIGATIFTLPAGYRPTESRNFATVSNGAFGHVYINTAGQVVPAAGSNVWFSLCGLTIEVF